MQPRQVGTWVVREVKTICRLRVRAWDFEMSSRKIVKKAKTSVSGTHSSDPVSAEAFKHFLLSRAYDIISEGNLRLFFFGVGVCYFILNLYAVAQLFVCPFLKIARPSANTLESGHIQIAI
jgi:hypothetical protein